MSALVLAGAAGCDDGSYLAPGETTTSTTSSTGGAGGAGGEGGAGGAGEGGGVVEPPGPPALTVVNGVNDREAIRLCFVPYPGDGVGVLPWPSGAAGLAFGKGVVIGADEGVVTPGVDVQVHVVAGDLGATVGRDCAEILALAGEDQAVVQVAALPVVPGAVFEAERSLVLVPAGCLGGAGQTDPAEVLACGSAYTEDNPTVSLVAAPMSRLTRPDRVSFQVVHASVAMPKVDVRLASGPADLSGFLLAPGLTFGAAEPFPPTTTLTVTDLDTTAQIRTHTPGQTSNATSSVPLSEVRDRSGLGPEVLDNGGAAVLVAVGAAPGLPDGPFWHALNYVLIRADP
ncbi:hypothetical protein [Chondromyces apiculatus]|uniref:hypothetical protein n=1 Tax=Chondromyces apiculatus TaxID=51 RepID=UPI0012DC6B82|nr:hypothetical protein [Chondromyces apiculatus]